MFKLDIVSLSSAIARGASQSPEPEHVTQFVVCELARQLRDTGAPDAPLEEQLRAMLASHLAIARAGEEMPGESRVADIVHGQCGDDEVAENAAPLILDLFRPIFARLTQERDEARTTDDRRARAASEVMKSFQAETHAIRQRAERAERELAVANERDMNTRADALAAKHDVLCLCPATSEYDPPCPRHGVVGIGATGSRESATDREELYRRALAREQRANIALRARIAELEASREPGKSPPRQPVLVQRGLGEVQFSTRPIGRYVLIAEGLDGIVRVATDAVPEDMATMLHEAMGAPSRPKPAANMVDHLAEEVRVAWVAWAKTQPNPKPSWIVPWAGLSQQDQDADRAIARHLLSHLAAMGEEAWPIDAIYASAWAAVDRGAVTLEDALLDAAQDHASAVIGALRSRVAELEAAIAEMKAIGPAQCEWHECEAGAVTIRTDLGGSPGKMCAKHAEEGTRRGYWREVKS